MSEVNKVSDMNNPADYDLGAEEILQEEIAIQHLMEGYIMPNNFNTDLLEPQEISAVEQQRILNKTMQHMQNGQNVPSSQSTARSRRSGVPRRTLWGCGLGFFNAESGQLPQQSGQEINMQDSNENGTLRVEQVVGDSQSVYVLLDFVAPEGTVLNYDSYIWERAHVSLSESTGAGYYFEELPDDDPADNHLRMMLCLQTNVSLKGQRIDLDLGGLKGYITEDMDYTQPLPGEWKLGFVLDYTPTSDVLPQNVDIKLGEATAHVSSLEISPFTIIVDVDVDNPEGYMPPAGYVEPQGGSVEIADDGTEKMIPYSESPVEIKISDLLADLDRFEVTLQDGSVLQTSGGGGNAELNHHQIIFSFNQLLNLEDIASIKYQGQELQLR